MVRDRAGSPFTADSRSHVSVYRLAGRSITLASNAASQLRTLPRQLDTWNCADLFGKEVDQQPDAGDTCNLLKDTELAGITPHVLRHSVASIGNDLGFTESTIAALVGHSRGTVTSRYIHTVDTTLIMAADSIAGYIQGLLDGVALTHTAYALDRGSRKSALAHFLGQTNHAVAEASRAAA